MRFVVLCTLATLPLLAAEQLQPRAVIPTVTAIVNAATGEPVITSGGWASVYGNGFIWSSSGFPRPWLPADFIDGALPLQLNDISVRFNGVHTYVAYIGTNQINVLIPDDPTIGMVSVQEQGQLDQSNIIQVMKAPVAPGLFTFTPKYPSAVHLDGTYSGPAGILSGIPTTPAKVGELVVLYGTGFGPSNPKIDFSHLFTKAAPIAQTVTATVGGLNAKVDGFLVSPGVYQFNLVVPDVPAGDAPVVLSVAGSKTQTTLSLAVIR